MKPLATARSLIGLLLATGACVSSPDPRIVTIPEAPLRPVWRASAIVSYEQALETVGHVMERELGFGRFPVALEFYNGRHALAAALVKTGYDPAFARHTVEAMTAIGGHRRVLLNGSALSTMGWPERVALIAHELAHVLQYELGGGRRGTSDQWLREGFADWVSMNVLHRLHGPTGYEVRRRVRERLRSAKRPTPRLDEMVTFPQWVALSARGDGIPYAHALLATDFLIDRHGIPAVMRYFKLFAASDDRAANFRAAFGEDLSDFETALGGSRNTLSSSRR